MRGGSPSADTARTLILVGLILDIVFEVILLLVGLVLLVVPILGALVLGLALIGFVWVALVWWFSYNRVVEGDYGGARTPTLVFAILSLITLAVIPGVLFLIAYVKLGDAVEESARSYPRWGAPPSPFYPSPGVPGSRYCSRCGRADTAGGVYCQGCGAPLQ